MLVDAAGDDVYESRGLSQGFGLLGSGILWSHTGDDLFQSSLDVVRNPVVAGEGRGMVAWEELRPWEQGDERSLTWQAMARLRASCDSFPLLENDGRPIRDLTVSADGSIALLSRLREDLVPPIWEVVHIELEPTEDRCELSLTPSVLHRRPDQTSGAHSNKLHPIVGLPGDFDYIWQDDRYGEWDLFWNRGPMDSTDRSSLVMPGSNQTRPVIHGTTLVFEDDRHGASSVYSLNLRNFTQFTRVSVDPETNEPLPGEHVRPVVSGSLIAWQTRTEEGTWQVAVFNRHTNDLRILDHTRSELQEISNGEGFAGTFQPSVAGGRVAFAHGDGDDPFVAVYDWASDTIHIDGRRGIEPAVHPNHPGVTAWVDVRGTPARPGTDEVVDSPVWEIQWWRDDRPVRVTDSGPGNLGTLMQGAAWQGGVGLLLNNAGSDHYQARSFAQGAAFSRDDPNLKTTQSGLGENDYNLHHGAFGVLMDLDGNDIYRSKRASQGAHYGGQFENSPYTFCLPLPAPLGLCPPWDFGFYHMEVVQNGGILFDLRGSDRYAAQEESQGYAALVLGHNAIEGRDDPLVPNQHGRDIARDFNLIASKGAFVDLGGDDDYVYGDSITPLYLTPPRCWDLAEEPAALVDGVLDQDEIPLDEESMVSDLTRAVCREIDTPVSAVWEDLREQVHEAGKHAQVEWITDTVMGKQDTDRNNLVWHQPIREPPLFGTSVGGIGVDLSITDQVGHRLLEISNMLFEAQIRAFRAVSEGGEDLDWLQGGVALATDVEKLNPNLEEHFEVTRVETFIRFADEYPTDAPHRFHDGFQGYSRQEDCPQPIQAPNRWCLQWDTDLPSVPDGNYTIRTVVHYGLKALPGTSLGWVEETEEFPVDNLPRFDSLTVTEDRFSPAPFIDRGEATPGEPGVAFTLSHDPWVPGGDAWVRIDVIDEDGHVVKRLRDFFEGAVPAIDHEPRITWDGRDEQDRPVAPGMYTIRVEATDELDDLPDPARLRSGTVEVRVDSQPPGKSCVRTHPLGACNPSFVPVPDKGSVALPLWITAPSGTDPAWAHVFVKRMAEELEEWTPWNKEGQIFFSPGERVRDWQMPIHHGERTKVLTLIEDVTGNMECVPRCDGSHLDLLDIDPDEPLVDAAERKYQLDRHVEAWADYWRPVVELLDAGIYKIKGDEGLKPPTPVPRVGPNKWLEIHIEAIEETSGLLPSVKWFSDEEDVDWEDPVEPECISPTLEGDCPDSRYRLRWANWPGLVEARDWPDGVLLWEFVVRDGVGNPSLVRPDGRVVFDSKPPEVVHVNVIYPGGGSHVNRTGGLVTIEARVADDDVGVFFANPFNFKVLLDASAVTIDETFGPPDRLPLSYDNNRDLFHITFPVDRPDLELDQEGWLEGLKLHVADEAFNWNNETVVPLVLGKPMLGLERTGEDIRVDDAVLQWSTSKQTAVELILQKPGGPPKTIASPWGNEHVFHLTDLEPATLYTYRVTAVDAEGLVQSAGPFDVATHAGLSASLDAGITDEMILSGIETVTGEISVSSDADAEPRVRIFVYNDQLPGGSRLISDDVIRDGSFSRDLVTGALPDGRYRLELHVTYQSPVRLENKTIVVNDLIVDNTPPMVHPIEPGAGAVLTRSPGSLVMQATDEWTDINLSSARLRVDGIPVSDVVAVPYQKIVGHPPIAFECQGSLLMESTAEETPWVGICFEDGDWILKCLSNGDWDVGCEDSDGGSILPLDLLASQQDLDMKFRLVLPEPLPRGDVRLTVTLEDIAGNTGVKTFNVIHDPDPPRSKIDEPVTVSYGTGKEAARPGAEIRIRSELEDPSGVSRVVLDAGPLGGPSAVVMQSAGRGYEAVVKVGEVPTGAYVVNVTAVDKLGNEAVYQGVVHVLSEPIDLIGKEMRITGESTAVLAMGFTGPVNATVRLYEGDALVARVQANPSTLDAFPALSALRDHHGVVASLADLVPATEYKIVVEAVDPAGRTIDERMEWRFAPVVVEPPGISHLVAEFVRGNRVKLEWETSEHVPEDAIQFLVYRSMDGQIEKRATTWSTTYEDPVESGAVYEYHVQARNQNGVLGPPSGAMKLQIPGQAIVSEWGVTPSRGVEGTPFTFHTKVTGASTDAPVGWLVLDGTPYRMELKEGDCRDECRFTLTMPLKAAFRTLEKPYHIEVMDGESVTRGPAAGSATGPRVMTGTEDPGIESEEADTVTIFSVLAIVSTLAILFQKRRRRQ